MRQFFFTFTQSLRFNLDPNKFSDSNLAAEPIFFNKFPSWPIIIFLCDSFSQYILACISIRFLFEDIENVKNLVESSEVDYKGIYKIQRLSDGKKSVEQIG